MREASDADRRQRESAVAQLDADARRAHELRARAEHELSEEKKARAADALRVDEGRALEKELAAKFVLELEQFAQSVAALTAGES